MSHNKKTVFSCGAFHPFRKKFFRFNARAAPYALTEYKTARRIQKPKKMKAAGCFRPLLGKRRALKRGALRTCAVFPDLRLTASAKQTLRRACFGNRVEKIYYPPLNYKPYLHACKGYFEKNFTANAPYIPQILSKCVFVGAKYIFTGLFRQYLQNFCRFLR